MAEFTNTIDLYGDEFVAGKIVDRTITEFNDDTVPLVGNLAFSFCQELTKVNITNATSIGQSAFQYCSKLASVDLPNAISVGEKAFYNCTKLTSVSLPNATSIGTSAFPNCYELTSIDLPSATNIKPYAFQYCSKLTTVILRSTTVCTLGSTLVFTGTPFATVGQMGTVYCPASLIEQYQNETNWSTIYARGNCNFVAIEGSEYE